MNKKIKLLALILVFNLLAFISPETIPGNKAFAAGTTYDISEFFGLTDGNTNISGGKRLTNVANKELNKGDKIENRTNDEVEINYYGTSQSDTISGNSEYTIISENGITQWEITNIQGQRNYDSPSVPFKMTLAPLARDYDFTINGENSSKVSILDRNGNDISNMNINYSQSNNTYKIKGIEDYYEITSVAATLNGNNIGEYSPGTGGTVELIINGNNVGNYGTGTIEIEVELVVDLSRIQVGDILHPGDSVSGSKNIQWDSRGVIVDGAIEDYPNVAGQQDESFEGWKVISVSDDLIKVEPIIDNAESQTISIVIKLRNK